MRIKQSELIIDKDRPFDSCMLDRKQYAEILSKIVKNYSDGFVMSINNMWGTGKTTFMKMWQQHLNNEKIQTIYFNAWENDFESNPLVALIAELRNLLNDRNEKIYKSLIQKGAILTKNIAPALLKAIASKYINEDVFLDAIENTAKAASDILEDEIKEYSDKKENLKDFKIELEKFIQETDGAKPIVFIVDELDRCRPNYAVEVLEQIKHFFSVKGIVFVLAIDKEQLGHAIRGVYGSEKINSEEYLRRFIDLEYKLPSPDYLKYCNYLFHHFEFDSFFSSNTRKNLNDLKYDKDTFLKTASILFQKKNLTLRQQEKIFTHARIVLTSFADNQYIFPGLLVFLIFAKSYHSEFYNKLSTKIFDINEVLDEFSKLLPFSLEENEISYFTHLEANLAYMYNNYIFDRTRDNLFRLDDNGNNECILTSRINRKNSTIFVRQLNSFVENWHMSSASISYLIDRIDLTKNVNI